MRIKSEKDFWAGLMFVVIGLGFALGAQHYTFGTPARPGPGYFPFGLGLLLALLGAVVLLKSLTLESPGGDRIGAVAWRPVLQIVSAVVVFGWLVPRAGLFVALPTLVVLVSAAGDEFHWGEVLANATLLTLGCWLIFIHGLGLTVPLWPVFIG